MRARDFTFRSAALLTLLTFAAIGVMGYHPGAEDDFVYLPAIKHNLNPSLYPHDADFFRLQLQATVFDKVVAASVKVTHVPLDWALLIWQATAIFLVLLGCWKIASRCFPRERERWCGVATVAVLLTMPVAGTSLFLVDQHLHPRTLATAFILFAISAVLDRRFRRAAAWLVVALAFHPIMAAFGVSYCVFLAWRVNGGKWPLWRRAKSSASPQEPQGGKSIGARSSITPLLGCAALLMPLGWIFEQPTAAWREAAATRDYYFLGKQHWYEWLGTFAPLLLLWWFSKIGASRETQRTIEPAPAAPSDLPGAPTQTADPNHPTIRSSDHPISLLCWSLIYYALFQFAITLLIMLPPPLERWRTLQPLRYLHLLYLLMLLLGGGLLGQSLLKNKIWRWTVLFVSLATGMYLAQRDEFPQTAAFEMPWNTGWREPQAFGTNAWVRTFLWISENTPTDAYFALGPKYYDAMGEDWHSFRAIAERSQLADALKDPSVSTQVPRLADRWLREARAQRGWRKFEKADFDRLKREFGVNWVVTERQVRGLECPFTTSSLTVSLWVCRVE